MGNRTIEPIAPEQLDALRMLRTGRPLPTMRSLSVLMVLVAICVAALVLLLLTWPMNLIGVLVVAGCTRYLWPARAWRSWQRMHGATLEGDWMQVRLPHPGAGPALLYRTRTTETRPERLIIDPPETHHLTIKRSYGASSTAQNPTLDGRFDWSLRCAPAAVIALLGPEIRRQAEAWGQRTFAVHAGQVHVSLGPEGLDPTQPELHIIWQTVADLLARLQSRVEGLEALAQHTEHPLDASRALAEWADHALTDAMDAIDAPWADVACGRADLITTTLDDATRTAVGLGILGSQSTAQRRLLETLRAATPDGSSGRLMTWVDLFDGAWRMTGEGVFKDRRADALAQIGARGGPECLPWFDQFWRTGSEYAAAKAALTTRLSVDMAGSLSLDAASAGALSAVDAQMPRR